MTLDPKVSGELALIRQQRLVREARWPAIALVSCDGSAMIMTGRSIRECSAAPTDSSIPYWNG